MAMVQRHECHLFHEVCITFHTYSKVFTTDKNAGDKSVVNRVTYTQTIAVFLPNSWFCSQWRILYVRGGSIS